MKQLTAVLLMLSLLCCVLAGCAAPRESSPSESLTACTAPPSETTTEPDDHDAEPEFCDCGIWPWGMRVAMITDYGDITDQSFNQITYEACLAFAEANDVDFEYYKPKTNDTAARVAMTELAIAEGYNVIVMPGYAFGATLVEVAPLYPEVKFVALDVSASDILEVAVALAGEEYSWNPADYNMADYLDMSNVYCAVYQEELAGYMAGYAAVKLGYTKLGFLGGMAVPSVVRYGHGFIQGADAAAGELGVEVSMNYAYGNHYYCCVDFTPALEAWYEDGTEIIFACGGGIYNYVAKAAQKVGGKVIGVEVDQAPIIDGLYGEGITVTSAMKGLYPSAFDTLTEIFNGNWEAYYAGRIETLGIIDGSNPELNYVQIPMDSTHWNDTFTPEDYIALIERMYNGEIVVSNDIYQEPIPQFITVNYLGNLK